MWEHGLRWLLAAARQTLIMAPVTQVAQETGHIQGFHLLYTTAFKVIDILEVGDPTVRFKVGVCVPLGGCAMSFGPLREQAGAIDVWCKACFSKEAKGGRDSRG